MDPEDALKPSLKGGEAKGGLKKVDNALNMMKFAFK